MNSNSDYLSILLNKLSVFRRESGFSTGEVEEKLILGPGWVKGIEDGDIVPSLDVVASLLSVYNKSLTDLAHGLSGTVPHIHRSIYAKTNGSDLDIHFAYGKFDSIFKLKNATEGQFNQVILTMRNSLALLSQVNENDTAKEKAIKTESVALAFLKAVNLWPTANPSDIWWFLVYRAYCDQYNHPSEHARLDFSQSWKRTGGWALEAILQRHYAPTLKTSGINLIIADADRKQRLARYIETKHRMETDKMDVLLTVGDGHNERIIGVVHVKASFAERRTDDVPMSQALVEAGYISPLWTMDCKGTPSVNPTNRGELGDIYAGNGVDGRSAKRKDIEDDGFFSACFSYNKNTKATPATYNSRARVISCDFSNPNDAFTKFIIKERMRIKEEKGI
jgi:hypothetical protein